MPKRFSPTGTIISKKIGHAIGAYNMISPGDLIMIGLSGGKDSFTLLTMLSERRKFSPVKFDLHAVHVQPYFKKNDALADYIIALCKKLDVACTIKSMHIDVREDQTNCFWCSWNRRKIMFDMAKEMNINKIALGHHKDDIIETTLLNMFYVGDFSTMNPYQEFFDGRLIMIRPLVYCEEHEITAYADEYGFKELEKPCAYGRESKRHIIKRFIAELQKDSPQVKTNIFKSMSRIKTDYIDLREE
jgi:tRNA 2-thiocytidine biosynthesis protein TtcA